MRAAQARRERPGAPKRLREVKRAGKMPSAAADVGIWPCMHIHTSHDDRIDTTMPTETRTLPQSPANARRIWAVEGEAMAAMSPWEKTPKGTVDTRT